MVKIRGNRTSMPARGGGGERGLAGRGRCRRAGRSLASSGHLLVPERWRWALGAETGEARSVEPAAL